MTFDKLAPLIANILVISSGVMFACWGLATWLKSRALKELLSQDGDSRRALRRLEAENERGLVGMAAIESETSPEVALC